jgi:hypothetical protein
VTWCRKGNDFSHAPSRFQKRLPSFSRNPFLHQRITTFCPGLLGTRVKQSPPNLCLWVIHSFVIQETTDSTAATIRPGWYDWPIIAIPNSWRRQTANQSNKALWILTWPIFGGNRCFGICAGTSKTQRISNFCCEKRDILRPVRKD